ncbi:cyclin-A2-1-like [Cucurbita moschata]|uniref:B-like cyclin n=1 Tax=Cucurbita moschata TaxID=3662 RepID=A0A6J1GIJ2_CUCMO|nr:cyclin-A2-1-like [Cucurbita moschata]XP_022951360.1 cyclin-A2-1-like [Cucurbita moschata]
MMKELKFAVRITRSQSNSLSRLEATSPSLQVSLRKLRKRDHAENSERAQLDGSNAPTTITIGLRRKRRAVLKDVTNMSSESNNLGCLHASKIQVHEVIQIESLEDSPIKRTAESQVTFPMMRPDKKETAQKNKFQTVIGCTNVAFPKSSGLKDCQMKDEARVCDKLNHLGTSDAVSISEDPQACTLYAHNIYDINRVIELDQRPSTNYMEKLQKYITPIMRGILIDWLVEVSEEYKLVSDTLYLTVNLIDRFLSQSCIERHRLQLLGVSCMLIASKYEEVCAPFVEEFCCITDNTYTRGEVLKMEGEVLNLLNFQLSVPTTKTFLRRFVQVAPASCKEPRDRFEHLTNYLAELTLGEYSFLRFLPSAVAASVVFLAKWILNQPNNPWNPSLEQYTNYSISQLKAPVLALEHLRLNSSTCPFNAIFHKYRQHKFGSVATLTPTIPVLSAFQNQTDT